MWLLTLVLIEAGVAAIPLSLAWVHPQVWLAWRGIPRSRLEDDRSQPSYPDRGGDFVMEAAIAQLAAVDAQTNALDQKLGSVFAVSGALIALLPALVSRPLIYEGASGRMGSLETTAGTAAFVMFVFALANSIRGQWPQEFDLGPDLAVVREQLLSGYGEEDVRWAAIASIDKSIALNGMLLRPKIAALRLSFHATWVGVVLSLVAAAAHFSA